MNVKYYLNRLTHLSPHIAFYKILRKIKLILGARIESLRANRVSAYISDEEFLRSLNGSFASIQQFAGYLRKRKKPHFFINSTDSDRLVEIIKRYYPNSFDAAIADADEICVHNFDLLGSGLTHLGTSIDWHRDFKSGWSWKCKYYKLVDYVDLDKPYDPKVPWELSRCQHFVPLGKAYWYTDDEKYAGDFVDQVTDWIESNPPKFGINWVSTMDVAIRAVNWIWGYYFFKGSKILTNEFIINFLKCLLAHGRYIIANLENKYRFNTNHYISNLVGLIYLGIMLPEFKEAEKWRNFGVEELIRQMEMQVQPDGVDYESSIPYHRLVTEMFLSATLLVLLNRDNTSSQFPEWYINRLEKMIEFVLYYTKPDGSAPQFGDNDDGRLHILSNYGNWCKLDHRYLLSIGAVLFDRSDFKKGAGRFHQESLWLLGEKGLEKFQSLADENAKLKSKAFPKSGFYIMRHDDLYMIVDCVSNKPLAPSGHRHNSKLSFELSAYGKSFIVDPGTYIYTADPEWRNRFRSTSYHNTIQVDGCEQNDFDLSHLFSLGEPVEIRINEWQTDHSYDFLDAEYSGFESLRDPITHRRQILFHKMERYWIIRDILFNSIKTHPITEHEFELNLHLAPMELAAFSGDPLSINAGDSSSANIAIIPLNPNGLEITIDEGWVSYSYGSKVKAPVIKYRRFSKCPVNFITVFYPYSHDKQKMDTQKIREAASASLPSAGGTAMRKKVS
jgi:hypothetical protein